jgi:hypothetical protein
MEINGIKLINLSGPVNMYYFKPLDITLPNILLFGDIHHSSEGECNTKNENTTSIYSDNFLSLLNSLSSFEYPIDFYLEYFSTKTSMNEYVNEVHQITPMTKLMYNNCYFKETKNRNNCAAVDIRWQLTDVRHSNFKYIYEHKLWVLTMYLFDYNYPGFNYSFAEDKNHIPHLVSLINIILEDGITDGDKFIDTFFNIENPYFKEYSRIYKQIKKGLFSLDKWVAFFKMQYNTKIMTNKRTSKLTPEIISTFKKYMNEKLKNKITTLDDKYKKIFKPIGDIFLLLGAFFLDMYFVTRVFKPPKNDKTPWLVLGYFGYAHCNNLKYFLEDNIKLYKMVNYSETDPLLLRCLKTLPINLNSELEIFKHNNQNRKITLKNVFSYHNNVLDLYISKFTDVKYETLAEKRYMVINYLIKNNEFNETEKKLILQHELTFYDTLTGVNSSKELIYYLQNQ